MLNELAKLTSKTDNIKKLMKEFDLRITNEVSLGKIKEAYIKNEKHITNKELLNKATLSLCGSLQEIQRLGIDLNRSDGWFVSGYKTDLKAQYEYKALLRVASENGYPAFVRFESILKDEKFATYDDDRGIIRIDYRDECRDKSVTLENMEEKFRMFFCLIDIRNKDGKLLHQQKVQMTPKEILVIKSKTTTKDSYETEKWNYATRRKEKITKHSVWYEFTRQMIEKTLVKYGFRMIRETVPGLKEFFKFEEAEDTHDIGKSLKTENIKDQEIKIIDLKSDLNNPSEEQKKEIEQLKAEYKSTPEMKGYNKNKILQGLLLCKDLKDYQSFINFYIVKILSLDIGEKEEKEKYKELLKTIKDKEIELNSKNLDKDDKKPINNTTQIKEKSKDEKGLFERMYDRLNSSKDSTELNARFKEKKFQDGLRTVSADEKKQLFQLRESLIVEFDSKNK